MISTEKQLDLRQDAEYDITINKDRDLSLEIQAEIYSGTTFLSYFDFSTYTGATLQVKNKPTDSYSLLTFTLADSSIAFGIDGLFQLIKTASELSQVRSGEFYYDMYLSSATQSKRAFLSGRFIIKTNVST